MGTFEDLIMAGGRASSSTTTKSPDFNPNDPKYNFWTQLALSQASKVVDDSATRAAAMAKALGPQESVFGSVPEGTMLGLSPEQIMAVAASRTEQDYKRMLTSAGALEFSRTMSGEKTKEDIAKRHAEGGIQKDIVGMGQEGGVQRANIVGGNPVNIEKAGALRRFKAGNYKDPKDAVLDFIIFTGGTGLLEQLSLATTEEERSSVLAQTGFPPETQAMIKAFDKGKKADKTLVGVFKRIIGGDKESTTPGTGTSMPAELNGVTGTSGKDRYTDSAGSVWDWNYTTKRWEQKSGGK